MRLKPGAKVFLTIIVLALVIFGAYKLGWLTPLLKVVAPERKPQGTVDSGDFGFANQNQQQPNTGQQAPGDMGEKPADSGQPTQTGGKLSRPLKCAIILYGGMAGGLIANNGKAVNPDSIFSKDFDVDVELVQIDDMVEMANAFRAGGDNGGVDLMVSTVDMFAMQYPQLASIKPVTILQTDWSRGADAIAVAKGIGNVSQLKGKKVAVAEATPSHFLLLYILSQAGMKPSDINTVFTTSSIEAAQVFKAGKVDACVSWSPDVYIAASERPGATILASTREATSLLGGTIVARGDIVASYPDTITAFVKGWLKGAEMANEDPEMAAEVLARCYEGIRPEDATGMLMDVKLADAAGNRQLFELDGDALVGYDDLFNSASKIWKKVGLLPDSTRADITRNTSFLVEATEKLAGKVEPATEEFTFTPPTQEQQKQPPIVTKRISVYFNTGSYTLDDNAKLLLEQAAELAQTFGAAYIKISGNTDSVGSHQMNVELSRKRAQAVADFLSKQYGFDKDKFVVVGNGPDKPVASNDTEEGRAKNRRTDFEVIPQGQQ